MVVVRCGSTKKSSAKSRRELELRARQEQAWKGSHQGSPRLGDRDVCPGFRNLQKMRKIRYAAQGWQHIPTLDVNNL